MQVVLRVRGYKGDKCTLARQRRRGRNKLGFLMVADNKNVNKGDLKMLLSIKKFCGKHLLTLVQQHNYVRNKGESLGLHLKG